EVKRFRLEAEAAANLQHPNIVAIHEIGEHEGQHFFSMDFINGPSLAGPLPAGPLAVGEAARLVKIIAEAVQFAHEHGVLHRDLKPGNVLLDAAGQPHVTDFGLAKRKDREDHLTCSGAILGTPAYAAPEQVAGRHDLVGPASDVYSLGAILYEMLTGQPPVRGATISETISQVVQSAPKAPTQLNPRIPRDLETITMKCLEKRPDRRYASAGALAKDLEHFLNHEPISARPVQISKRAGRWLFSHPHWLAAFGSVVLLALLWFGFALWNDNRLLTWEKDHPNEHPAAPVFFLDPKNNPVLMAAIFVTGLIAGLEDLVAKRIRKRVLTGTFIRPSVLASFELAGILGIVAGVALGGAAIQIYQWAKRAAPLERREADQKFQEQLKTSAQIYKDAARRAESEKMWKEILYKSVDALEYQGTRRELFVVLFLPLCVVWSGATLFLKAFREQRFVFYLNSEDEQIERTIALSGIEREAQEKARHIPIHLGLAIIFAALVAIVPNIFWASEEEPPTRNMIFLAEGGSFVLLTTSVLIFGRKLSRSRLQISGILIVVSILLLFAALARMPTIQTALAISIGVLNGSFAGFLLRTMRNRNTAARMSTGMNSLAER
ncbi:MAG TPA: serine/threonine-protein kinase, partial [Verrucomicrobiae bacterium]|nr:serine/threonine-protein kinase [Verrucomicrobiae bacterium]